MTAQIRTATEQSLALHRELVALAIRTHQAATEQWIAQGDATRKAFALATDLQAGVIRAMLQVSPEPAKA